ncbi:hypothetical protein A8709_22930 [Paenibacillus pectinilyticus]|uniref:SLH domain-containing protein n=1 Tax=Paenibacillus pectinilyticus TaxID=512399 RepID=A0A1C0ZRL1_9BACL|nr:S-layer homology domain-containing protein [Paenibacillus pectinilyticus]OCT10694.1 hypothetical protein A8709_22930 [Paenibacillus pectinilyticus]
MTMKKKLAVTTLSASIMFASIAGLPLSEQGLASKLGISVGVASAAVAPVTIPTSVLEKLSGLHDELARDEQGFQVTKDVRDLITHQTLTPTQMKNLLGDVWTKLEQPGVDVASIFALINGLDLFYDDAGTTIGTIINNASVRNAVNVLFHGVDPTKTLTTQDVIAYQEAAFNALEANKADLLLSVAQAFSSGGTLDSIKGALNTIVTTKISQDLLLSKFLSHYHLTLNDLDTAQNNIATALGAKAISARAAIESAGIRYLLKDKLSYTPGTVTSTSVGVGTLKLSGVNLTSYLPLTWSALGTGVKVENNNKLVLDGVTSGSRSGVLQAHSKFDLLLFISDSYTLTATTTTTNPDTGSGSGSLPPAKDSTTQALDGLKDLQKDLAGASDAKKQEIFQKAQDAVKNAIQQLANLDLSSTIKVDGGTAKPTLNVADLANKMKEIAAKAKELNDQLKQLNPNAKTEKVQLNLDFGTISAKSTEIPLAKELLAAAIANGVDKVAISMNGLSLGISPSEFGADTTLKVTNQDTTVATNVTQLPVAAGVYEFEFSSGGNKVSSFSTPIEVTIPVPNGSKFDTELLSLAKIVDGKLEFYGGSYNNGVLNAVRNGFSTYTVVENKVAFNDTTSVKAWAGRQIQVAAAKGILEGRAEQAFDPNGLVTRAEFAKMIVKTFSLENANATENFSDVNDSDWFKVYVASAVQNGIVNGKEAGKFDPNGSITRAEMAVMSSRALALKGITLSPAKVEEALKGFTDAASINASLKDGVALAASEGIVIGEEGNAFNPNANSTRAQAAVVIYRLLNK